MWQDPYEPPEQKVRFDLPSSGYDVISDAKKMLEILEKEWLEEEKKKKKEKSKTINFISNGDDEADDDDSDAMSVDSDGSDADQEVSRHQGCSVTNGDIWKGYSTLMTKIDVTFGAWGLYNYYRMEARSSVFFIGQ